jgi:hypothetical protein
MALDKTLTLKEWEGIDAPRMYMKDSTRKNCVDVITICRWDEPSVPMYLDHLCQAAEQYSPTQARAPPPIPFDHICTGTVSDALGRLSPDMRSGLARRDPTLVEKVRGILDAYVITPRQRDHLLQLIHLEGGMFPKADILRKRRTLDDNFTDVVELSSGESGYVRRNLGFLWICDAHLDPQHGLLPDADIHVLRRGLNHETRPPTPAQMSAARQIVQLLAETLDGPNRLAGLYEATACSMPATLIPIVYHLAEGGEGAVRPMMYLERIESRRPCS